MSDLSTLVREALVSQRSQLLAREREVNRAKRRSSTRPGGVERARVGEGESERGRESRRSRSRGGSEEREQHRALMQQQQVVGVAAAWGRCLYSDTALDLARAQVASVSLQFPSESSDNELPPLAGSVSDRGGSASGRTGSGPARSTAAGEFSRSSSGRWGVQSLGGTTKKQRRNTSTIKWKGTKKMRASLKTIAKSATTSTPRATSPTPGTSGSNTSDDADEREKELSSGWKDLLTFDTFESDRLDLLELGPASTATSLAEFSALLNGAGSGLHPPPLFEREFFTINQQTVNSLSDPLLVHTFSMLPFSTFSTLALVCSRWHVVVQESPALRKHQFTKLLLTFHEDINAVPPSFHGALSEMVALSAASPEHSVSRHHRLRSDLAESSENVEALADSSNASLLTPTSAKSPQNPFPPTKSVPLQEQSLASIAVETEKDTSSAAHMDGEALFFHFAQPSFSYSNSFPVTEEQYIELLPAFMSYSQFLVRCVCCYYFPLPAVILTSQFQRYNAVVIAPLRRRLVALMKLFVKSHFLELSAEEKSLLRSFVLSMAKSHRALIAHALGTEGKFKERYTAKENQILASLNARWVYGSKLVDIFDVPPVQIAKFLTVIEFQLFELVRSREFLKQAWAKRPENAVHVRLMIDRFNSITRWIVSLVVSADKLKTRVKRWVKFVKIAEQLLENNDYHTLLAVLSGLEEGPVYRLKHTMAEIPPKVMESFKYLKGVLDAAKSYASYREHKKTSTVCIPYLGIHLRDFVYFDDGLKNDERKINVKTLVSLSAILQEFSSYQQVGYELEIANSVENARLYSYLCTFPEIHSMEEALEISKNLEPRNAPRDSIA